MDSGPSLLRNRCTYNVPTPQPMSDLADNTLAPTGSTSSSLIVRVQAGDAEAWRRLAALYAPLIYGWVRSAGFQPSDAADISQEVFGAVAAGLPSFQRDRAGDSFRGWL